jgi:hypothetical protein
MASRRRKVDRKIVELWIAGKSQNQVVDALSAGKKRVRRARQEAEKAGYLDGVPLPPYPEAVFPDPADRRRDKRSHNDDLLQGHLPWIKERLSTGWQPITVWEELPMKVPRSSFYRFVRTYSGLHPSPDSCRSRVRTRLFQHPRQGLPLSAISNKPNATVWCDSPSSNSPSPNSERDSSRNSCASCTD